MSISVHLGNVSNSVSGYSYFSGTLYNCDGYPVINSYPDRFNACHFSAFTTFPDHSSYNQSVSHEQTPKWLNEICTDSSRKNFAEEKMNINSLKSGSTTKNFINQENNESKSKIWRPFSPPPSSQESNVRENICQRKSFKNGNRNTFFSIKPSNVKIGLSKSSVFKAVKKNIFTCTQCSTKYLSNRQLNSHMRVHTGSKPFRCEYPNCFKTFARNEELTRHKRIHSGFKPHICTICKKRFGRKDHLSKHLKTHLQTSEKKVYQCPFSGCGHRYTRSDALTRHKSTAHAIKSQK